MHLTVHENTGDLRNLLNGLSLLRSATVRVGLPASAGPKLRMILAIQEHGSPIMNIPPRPVVESTLSKPETRQAMAEPFAGALPAALAGDLAAVRSCFEAAGQAGADAIRAAIDAGLTPPNAPVTVSGGWVRNRPAGKNIPVAGKGFNKPLYDTGALFRAFSYEVDPSSGG